MYLFFSFFFLNTSKMIDRTTKYLASMIKMCAMNHLKWI